MFYNFKLNCPGSGLGRTINATVPLPTTAQMPNPVLSDSQPNTVSPAQAMLQAIEAGSDIDIDVASRRRTSLPSTSDSPDTPVSCTTCTCKGQCATRACPCRKRNAKCTTCDCGRKRPCRNKVNIASSQMNRQQTTQESSQSEELGNSDMVEELTVKDAYDFIRFAIQRHPEVEQSLHQFKDEREQTRVEPACQVPWCKCGRCRQMPTEKERLCCRKGQQHGQCIINTRRYHTVVLDTDVVTTAVNSEAHDNARLNTEVNNRSCRHMAYRQFVITKYGHCGAGNRKVVPSCVTWAIRDKWPSMSGQYRGYID